MTRVDGRLVRLVPADEETLFTVYQAVRSSDLRLDGTVAGRRQLLSMQLAAQRHEYGRLFPMASWRLIVCDADAVGWIVVDRSGTEIRCLDVGLLEGVRRRGIASYVFGALKREAAGADLPVTLTVRCDNVAARAVYDHLGFQLASRTASHLHLTWRSATGAGALS